MYLSIVQENEAEYLEKQSTVRKAFDPENTNWFEEEEKWVSNKFGQPYKIVRLIYKKDKEDKVKKARRIISITKKNKSIGIDIESVFGLTAAMRLLANDYVSDDLK